MDCIDAMGKRKDSVLFAIAVYFVFSMRFDLSQLVVSEKHMSLTDFLKLLWIDVSFLRFLFCILQRWADFLINIGLLIVPKETWASLSYH